MSSQYYRDRIYTQELLVRVSELMRENVALKQEIARLQFEIKNSEVSREIHLHAHAR